MMQHSHCHVSSCLLRFARKSERHKTINVDTVYAVLICRSTMAGQFKPQMHVDGKPNYSIVRVTVFLVTVHSILSFSHPAEQTVDDS